MRGYPQQTYDFCCCERYIWRKKWWIRVSEYESIYSTKTVKVSFYTRVVCQVLYHTLSTNSILDCEVQIPGYDIIRSDRNRNGGGVAMYIRTVIPYIIRKDLSQDTLELLSIEVKKP